MTKKKPLQLFARLLGNERWQFITIPAFSILCSLVAISVIILLIGKNPLEAFSSLLAGAGWIAKSNYAGGKAAFTDFMDMLDAFTPMLFAALAVTVALKSGLFNIGVAGQMLLSGFIATVAVGYSDLPSVVARPLVLLIGIVVGAAAGALMGWLKDRFNIHEVVSSIMLNYIFQYVISFFIKTRYIDPVSRQSRMAAASARLEITDIKIAGVTTHFPLGLVLALIAAIGIWFLLAKTKTGLELTATGLNAKSARYAGIRTGRTLIIAMGISGALAGLAGVTYYLGSVRSIIPGELTSVGFDSIAVALLGNTHPLGNIASSLLITTLTSGSTYMSSTVGVRQEIASLIVGMILLFSACGGYLKLWVQRATSEQLPDKGSESVHPRTISGQEEQA
ncbi:MAG: ABC transporter permease [Actinomycetes bacterium]|jgi:simple sugar transport system permease protein|nr:ABC transporter permease [Actinomycetes bacterium]